jgi:hypothetical protein
MKLATNFLVLFLLFSLIFNTGFNYKSPSPVHSIQDYNHRDRLTVNNYPRLSGAGNYAAGYGNVGWNPFTIRSTYSGKASAHINVRNALDNAYFQNQNLFNVQGMSNSQRYMKSTFHNPNGFYSRTPHWLY